MAYDENFYKIGENESVRTAQAIVPLLMYYVMPQSVIDVGCGIGAWLEAFKQRGCEICGLDGDYVKRDMLHIAPSEFHSADLTNPITVSQKFDLATSIEVAEHLPQERAVSFVHDLTKLSDVVCFSAAIPTQEGEGHINCQWQSYWAGLFRHFGYVAIDCIRPRVWGRT